VQLPITIELHRSRFLDRLLIALALLASGAILAFPKPPVLLAALLLVVGALFLWSWQRLAPTLSALRLERGGNILAAGADHSEFSESSLLPRATVHPWLTVFRLELADGRQHVIVLARDSMVGDDFRRLRVFLRWRAQFSAGDDNRGEPCS
jgi:toxin CptA